MHAVIVIRDDGKEYVIGICADVYAAQFIIAAYSKNNETMQNPVRYEARDLQKTS